jgi:PhnB protein
MQLDPYLNFNGTCAAAFKFYEKVLGGTIQGIMTHAESPMADKVAPEWRDKVIHARLVVGNRIIMGSDVPPEYFKPAQGFSITLSTSTPEESERLFNALAEGGKIQMPLQKTFWSPSFGALVDQFGTPWMINCDQAA